MPFETTSCTSLSFSPALDAMEQIQRWLAEEEKEHDKSFNCNWGTISKAYQKREVACLSLGSESVGFLVWSMNEEESIVTFDIVAIRPDIRGKGLGRFLVERAFDHFANKQIHIAELESKPEASKPFWQSLGFCDKEPPRSSSCHNAMFRYLCEVSHPVSSSESSEILELWNKEPYEIKEDAIPSWTWEIQRVANSRILEKPIVFPCNVNWRLRWRSGFHITHYDEKVKRFTGSANSRQWNRYMVITELEFPEKA